MKTGIKMLDFLKKLDKKSKILLLIIAGFVFIDVAILVVKFAANRKHKVFLSFETSSLPSEELSLKKTNVSGKKYFVYKFSDNQKKLLRNYYEKEETVSLTVRFSLNQIGNSRYEKIMNEEQFFYFGFVTNDNFLKNGKFDSDISKIVFSGTDLRNFIADRKKKTIVFDNSLAIEKNLSAKNMPCGFVVYSSIPVEVKDCCFEKSKIGFDLTKDIPFYGVPSNGGSFGNISTVDFYGSALVFPTQNSSYYVMPEILLTVNAFDEKTEAEDSKRIKINANGEILTVYRNQNDENLVIQTESLSSPFGKFQISSNNGIKKLLMVKNESRMIPENGTKVLYPLKTDPGLLTGIEKASWRVPDYELYEWDRMDNILFFDTKDYEIQSMFFRRLAFFAEKAGFRGKILTDEQLGDMHGYNAHDYRAETLADFFTKAEKCPEVLNSYEYLLKEILIVNGIIKASDTGSGYEAINGAVISISQESPEYLRRSLSAHEIWHGLFFTDEDFRNTTAAIYYTIDPKAVDFLIGYWTKQSSLNYDPNDVYLMKNEFMAYIMQQDIKSVAKYFVRIANFQSTNNAIPELCEYIRNTNAAALEDAAYAFESYVNDRWGLACGRVALVTRLLR